MGLLQEYRMQLVPYTKRTTRAKEGLLASPQRITPLKRQPPYKCKSKAIQAQNTCNTQSHNQNRLVRYWRSDVRGEESSITEQIRPAK